MDNELQLDGFEWDKGNFTKSFIKHRVTFLEAEEMFYNKPLFFLPDKKHSSHEKRLIAFGKTKKERLLTVVFTLRKRGLRVLVRVISVRPMHRKERKLYEKTTS